MLRMQTKNDGILEGIKEVEHMSLIRKCCWQCGKSMV